MAINKFLDLNITVMKSTKTLEKKNRVTEEITIMI